MSNFQNNQNFQIIKFSVQPPSNSRRFQKTSILEMLSNRKVSVQLKPNSEILLNAIIFNFERFGNISP